MLARIILHVHVRVNPVDFTARFRRRPRLDDLDDLLLRQQRGRGLAMGGAVIETPLIILHSCFFVQNNYNEGRLHDSILHGWVGLGRGLVEADAHDAVLQRAVVGTLAWPRAVRSCNSVILLRHAFSHVC